MMQYLVPEGGYKPKKRGHCRRGHKMTESNSREHWVRGYRCVMCRRCESLRAKARYHAKKGETGDGIHSS